MAAIEGVMGQKSAPPLRGVAVDRLAIRFAERQHGVVARRQLLAAGVGAEAIRHRLKGGRLSRVHAGVYAVGRPGLSLRGRWMAAVLAGGPGAVLSHASAAALWGLWDPKPGAVHVTIPRRGVRARAGLAVHSTRSLPRAEVTTRERIATTTVECCLLDLAGTASPARVERAVEQAFALRLLREPALEAVIGRAAGRAGTAELRELMGSLLGDLPSTRSELERRFVKLVSGAGLPAPLVNRRVEGHLVDFHWPRERLVVETDGRRTHDTPYGFHNDHRRDLDLELGRWHVIRLTWRQVVHEHERVLELLGARLRAS
jgi:very-short-patch-repair endonuclease